MLKVEKPGDYDKEVWTMTESEKIKLIPTLKEDGNVLYKEKNYTKAAEKYGEALGLLEELVLK